MGKMTAFCASYKDSTAPTAIHVMLNRMGLSKKEPTQPILPPADQSEKKFVCTERRRPVRFTAPTRGTPALDHRYTLFWNNKETCILPTPSSDPPAALYLSLQDRSRNSALIQALVWVSAPLHAPFHSTSCFPVALSLSKEATAKISKKLQSASISWRGGRRISVSDQLLSLGCACLILSGFQSFTGAVTSGSKSPAVSVEMRAVMLALTGAFGSFKFSCKL